MTIKSNDPKQQLGTPRRGEQITSGMLRQMADKIRNSIVGGQGILVRRISDQLVIDATGGNGGGGTSGTNWYTATTKAGLIDASTVAETSMARVTAGDDQGSVYVVNVNKNGWLSINFWE